MTLVTVKPAAPGGKDAWGSTSRTYGTPYSIDVMVAPRATSESASAGYENRVIEGVELFTPPGVTIGPQDRVVIAGVEYEVEGVHGRWLNGFDGVDDGGQVALKRVSG